MSVFSGSQSKPKPETPPSIDAARQKIQQQKRRAGLRGRAAALLVQGSKAPETAKRKVTGS